MKCKFDKAWSGKCGKDWEVEVEKIKRICDTRDLSGFNNDLKIFKKYVLKQVSLAPTIYAKEMGYYFIMFESKLILENKK